MLGQPEGLTLSTPTKSLMTNRLFDALEQRFDDFDEVKDISRHGMSGGFNGFIYTYELREFFDKYENEIEDLMYEVGVTYEDLNDDPATISSYITAAVWWAVEHWAIAKEMIRENELSEEYALANAY